MKLPEEDSSLQDSAKKVLWIVDRDGSGTIEIILSDEGWLQYVGGNGFQGLESGILLLAYRRTAGTLWSIRRPRIYRRKLEISSKLSRNVRVWGQSSG